jgi:hypothetical protein
MGNNSGCVVVGSRFAAGAGTVRYRDVQLSPEFGEAPGNVEEAETAAFEEAERELEGMGREGEAEDATAEWDWPSRPTAPFAQERKPRSESPTAF